jgi:hypothetical protein
LNVLLDDEVPPGAMISQDCEWWLYTVNQCLKVNYWTHVVQNSTDTSEAPTSDLVAENPPSSTSTLSICLLGGPEIHETLIGGGYHCQSLVYGWWFAKAFLRVCQDVQDILSLPLPFLKFSFSASKFGAGANATGMVLLGS